jgi:hypothetical protein
LGYAYTIKNITYSDNVLSFYIKHSSYSDADHIASLTIIAEDRTETIKLTPMVRGISRNIVVENIKVGTNFSVYPDECGVYAVVCDMKSQSCR